MNQTFESVTEKQRVLVEYITDAGSAFAVNLKGESVFINGRIVERMNVRAETEYDAFVLPNYLDKRDVTPWRVMRLELAPVVQEVEPLIEVTSDDVLVSLGEDPRAVTVGTLADDMGITPEQSSRLLNKLHATGKLGRAAFYLNVASERASRCAYFRAQDAQFLFDALLDWQMDT